VKKINYSILSDHRTLLMGFAIIIVMLYHATLKIDNSYLLNFIKNTGNCGVDIFFFVSGIGMYFSFKKCPNIKLFYKKRFQRIFPLYFPIVFIYSSVLLYLGQINFQKFIFDITTLNLWFNSGFQYWYISAIILLYILTPIYMRYYFKKPNKTFIIALIISFLLILIGQVPELFYLRIFLTRLPIYLIGIHFGEKCYKRKTISNAAILAYFLFFIMSVVSLIVYFKYYQYDILLYSWQKISYIFLTISGCLILCIIFEFIINKLNYKFIILKLIGMLTLEIYIFHERVIYVFDKIFNGVMLDKYNLIMNLIIFIITIGLALAWNKTTNLYKNSNIFNNKRHTLIIKELKKTG